MKNYLTALRGYQKIMLALFAPAFLIAAVFIGAPIVRAELAELPEPVSSVPLPTENCQWMGEFRFEATAHSSGTTPGTTTNFENNSSEANHFVTAPVENQECGALFSSEVNKTSEFSDLNVCENNHITTVTGGGEGTGSFSASILPAENQLHKTFIEVQGLSGYSLTTTTQRTQPGCGSGPAPSTSPFTLVIDNHICQENIDDAVGLYIDPGAQASVGSCVFTESISDEFLELESNATFSWRIRKIDCDHSIDSDNGGTSDCQEYEDNTNPMNAEDDIIHESPELTKIKEIAASTGNQCFGKVMELAANDPSGQGAMKTIESWNLVGLPGITIDSTFKQKQDALKAYCQAN